MLFTRTLGYCMLSIPIENAHRNQITCHGSTEVTIFHLRINISIINVYCIKRFIYLLPRQSNITYHIVYGYKIKPVSKFGFKQFQL